MAPKLSQISVGTRLRVLPYQADSAYVRQLQRLGLTAGTEISIVRHAPLGDPIEIRLRGYSLALRPSEADALVVEVLA